jgi:hypothetical protein
MHKAKELWKIPMIVQFLDAIDADDFEKLLGQKETKIDPSTDFIKLPNHVMTHPLLFTALQGDEGETEAKIA